MADANNQSDTDAGATTSATGVAPMDTCSAPSKVASVAAAAPPPPPLLQQEHSCEICGASGLSDDVMREHTRTCHVEGSAQCPFCGLSGVAPAELLLHVNQAHLDYLTPDNELMSFIDDQTPSMDGDSDSMSECPNGFDAQQQQQHTAPATNGDATAKLNGGSCVVTNQPTVAASSAENHHSHRQLHRQNGHASYTHHNNHQQSHRTFHSKSTTTASNGKGQQTKITSFYNTKSMSADATHSDRGAASVTRDCRNGCCTASASRSARGVSAHRAMHALKAAHETRSCDNNDVLVAASLAAGRDHHSHHHQQNGSAVSASGSASSSACASPSTSTPTSATATAGGGGNGSPLRSQLGLNLKSAHTPAAAVVKSPLQCPMCPYTSDSSNVLEEHINRSHFDPHSPSMNGTYVQQRSAADGSNATAISCSSSSVSSTSSTSVAAAATRSGNAPVNGDMANNHDGSSTAANGHGARHDTLTALACPICGKAFEAPSSLELHVNIEHRDILSPAATTQSDPTTTADGHTTDNAGAVGGSSATAANPTSPSCCPVCNISLDSMSTQQMEVHIEAHFPKSPQPPSTTAAGASAVVAGGASGGADADLEKQAQKLREQREFEMLRAQYGMDDQGNFREQSAAGMQRAVYAGEMSVADYYERQVGLRAAESHGIDDGTSCTRSVAPRVASLSATSPNVMRSLMCSAVDHYASSYGDKGWGCGYRNLQMMLSSLLQNTTYNEALYSAWGIQGPSRTAMPSISRLQKMVEAAWAQGFDVQGSEQLGCKLHNTRKWIGATEVVTVLSWLRINCQLIDFHRPTSTDGRHPDLFNWVLRYFEEPSGHTPPLYLQHQGHSRTIIGIEQRANGPQLLILDPSHGPRQVAALGSSQDSLRLIRRGSTAMRAPQYQIVAIRGLIETEDQYQASKVLRSLRIPPDC